MWAVTTQSFLPTLISYIPPPPLSKPPRNTTFSTVQLRRRNPHLAVTASSHDPGELAHAVFSALKPDPSSDSSTSKKPKPNKVEEISGSDILRALQKASARKANTKRKRQAPHNNKGSSEFKSNSTHMGKKGVDLGKVRPITIKSDWATRLTDLEKRLQQFSAF